MKINKHNEDNEDKDKITSCRKHNLGVRRRVPRDGFEGALRVTPDEGSGFNDRKSEVTVTPGIG
jgi:hypothetical protein